MEKYTMMDYILETPSICKANIERYKELVAPLLEQASAKDVRKIWLVASGSSYNACHCARTFMRNTLGCEVKVITPFTFVHYENDVHDQDLIFVISQSGLSTNAIEAIKKIKAMGIYSICLTGNVNSDIKQYADLVVDYGVGEELVGYVTKGVTTLCLFLMLFAIALSRKEHLLKELEKAVALNEEMIQLAQNFITDHYKNFMGMNHIYFCGAGGVYGVALEGALKIGETVHIPSCCYEVEEYIHGPNLQLTPNYNVLIFDGNDSTSERVKQIYLATKEVTDKVYLISAENRMQNDKNVLQLSKTVHSDCLPIAYLPFIQILSHVISSSLNSSKQHPLLKNFKRIASAKTESFVNYDNDD